MTSDIMSKETSLWSLASSSPEEWNPEKKLAMESLLGSDKSLGLCSLQDEETGESLLMRAAKNGNVELVTMLLKFGAPWNALDRDGRCAGEFALQNGHAPVAYALIDWAVQAEMLLGAIGKEKVEHPTSDARLNAGGNEETSKEYLSSEIEFSKNGKELLDSEGDAVMMEWERNLMQVHAQVVCHVDISQVDEQTPKQSEERKLHILNVGFGMGIFDSYVQELEVAQHTIIEAHPGVYERMVRAGWKDKPGVNIIFGTWQTAMPTFSNATFDGVFFDTYGEYYDDMREFHRYLPNVLKPGGIYSFFNGLCPRNTFFHIVACQMVQLELGAVGISTTFVACEIKQEVHDEETWKNTKRRYWWSDTYNLPICILQPKSSEEIEST